MKKMKKIAILGSTGSIGTQTLEVVRENGDLEVLGLAAGNNIKLLEEQIREFHPRKVVFVRKTMIQTTEHPIISRQSACQCTSSCRLDSPHQYLHSRQSWCCHQAKTLWLSFLALKGRTRRA